jgi:uncharacterized protein YjbI with pentapeptide repeats
MQGADLTACFSDKGPNFSDAKMQGANLSSVKFEKAIFAGADLTGANLEGAEFKDCNVANLNLSSTKRAGLKIINTEMTPATEPMRPMPRGRLLTLEAA